MIRVPPLSLTTSSTAATLNQSTPSSSTPASAATSPSTSFLRADSGTSTLPTTATLNSSAEAVGLWESYVAKQREAGAGLVEGLVGVLRSLDDELLAAKKEYQQALRENKRLRKQQKQLAGAGAASPSDGSPLGTSPTSPTPRERSVHRSRSSSGTVQVQSGSSSAVTPEMLSDLYGLLRSHFDPSSASSPSIAASQLLAQQTSPKASRLRSVSVSAASASESATVSKNDIPPLTFTRTPSLVVSSSSISSRGPLTTSSSSSSLSSSLPLDSQSSGILSPRNMAMATPRDLLTGDQAALFEYALSPGGLIRISGEDADVTDHAQSVAFAQAGEGGGGGGVPEHSVVIDTSLIKPVKGFRIDPCFPTQMAMLLKKGRDQVDTSDGLDSQTMGLDAVIESTRWYNDHFWQRDHYNFVGNSDALGPVIVSLSIEPPNYRAIVRTKYGNQKVLLPMDSVDFNRKSASVYSILREVNPLLPNATLRLIGSEELPKRLLEYERREYSQRYQFGVLLCRGGQSTEQEMFGNSHGGEEWDDFLALIGEKIVLNGWQRFAGGLDTKGTNTTGTNAIYTTIADNEIIFHVSTMLPHNNLDKQQIEKKRHIGNDIVLIIFQEGHCEPYLPTTTRSEMIHVFVIVRVEKKEGKGFWHVSVCSKSGVPEFGPFLPSPPLFEKGPGEPNRRFLHFLLTKCINGSLAAYRGMSSLASKMAIARNSLLNELVEESKKLPVIETQAQLATAQSGSRKLLRRATLGMLKKGSNIHPT